MTGANARAEAEQSWLLLMAERTEQLRAGITVPSSPADQPDLARASKQLADITGLVRDLSDEVLFRSVESRPRAVLDQVISAYADAPQQAGDAVASYSNAYALLGFQRRYQDRPDRPDLRDAREHGFAAIHDRLDWARDSLAEGAKRLRTVAEHLDGTPPRTRAARSRTTQRVTDHPRAPAAPSAPPRSAPKQGPGRTR